MPKETTETEAPAANGQEPELSAGLLPPGSSEPGAEKSPEEKQAEMERALAHAEAEQRRAPIAMTADERELYETLNELANSLVAPVNVRFMRLWRRVEARAGLPTGAIGATHRLNPETMQIEPLS